MFCAARLRMGDEQERCRGRNRDACDSCRKCKPPRRLSSVSALRRCVCPQACPDPS